jgi:inner membrane protein
MPGKSKTGHLFFDNVVSFKKKSARLHHPQAFSLVICNPFFVDALSHALIATIIPLASGLPDFIPFAVIGAVIPDVDIFFSPVSDRSPRLYLFTHGGIAHSVAGAVALSVLAFLVIGGVRAAGLVPSYLFAGYGIAAFAFILGGALLHLFIDLLACPGIPILAPFSDRKYTLGILPGPSLLLMGAAVGISVLLATGHVPVVFGLSFYAAIVVLYLACRTGVFLFVAATVTGQRVPTINPFRWLVITQDDDAFTIRPYTVFGGVAAGDVIKKFQNTDAREIAPYVEIPDVRRVRFYSWIMTAEKDGASLVFSDPLREKGYVYYPPAFRRVAIPLEDTA